jgi:hypothetical protein
MTLYGFHNLKDLAAARISGTLIESTNEAIQLAVAEHNRIIDTMMAVFVDRTTLYSERYAQISNANLQPLDDNGRALPIKPAGYYTTQYPIQSGGSAWGANYVTRTKMTVADAERATAMMLTADANWMRTHILAALFASATWTFVDDLYGSLTIQPLALASDNVTYGVVGGGVAATDTHQLAQANAIGAGADNPFPLIYADLVEHPQNSGEVVSFIATSLKATTTALATFNPVADANIQPGSGADRLVGTLGIATPGKLIGYEDSGVWIVEWPQLPAGYIVSTMTGGDRAIAMREDPEAELQGFNRVADRDDHPWYEGQYLRRAGFGARNRVGAVVTRIGNGTYAAPTGYAPPI